MTLYHMQCSSHYKHGSVNYSDHLLLSDGVVNGMDPMLRNNQKMVECKDYIFVKIKD
eukprot:UN09173